MNEKINKLWDKAVTLVEQEPDGDWSLDTIKDKFAELLLNEIANTAVIYDGYIDESRQLAVKLHLGDFRKRIPIIGD